MSVNVAYLAGGKLHLKIGDDPVRIVESKFGQSIRQRALQIQRRHAWKTEGRGAKFTTGGLLWGAHDRDPAEIRVAISSLSRGRDAGELLYSLDTDDIGGLFAVRNGGAEEQRIFHSADRRVRDLCAVPGKDHIACSVVNKFGTSNIALRALAGSEFIEVTEGDSIDLAPRWIPGSPRQIVFQSAGVGRNASGATVGQGPFTVQKLDLDSGEMTSLAEEPEHDLLGPQVDGKGDLYFIRRPYGPAQRPGIWRLLWDACLVPFRVLHAIFQWLNFMTVAFTGKPLNASGDVRQKQMDVKQMMIWGNLIDAEKAAREARTDGTEPPPLVPKTWELIRKTRDGSEQIIAHGVLSFDLCDDGSPVYSNGNAIYHVAQTGKAERLVVDSMIQQVIAIGSP